MSLWVRQRDWIWTGILYFWCVVGGGWLRDFFTSSHSDGVLLYCIDLFGNFLFMLVWCVLWFVCLGLVLGWYHEEGNNGQS